MNLSRFVRFRQENVLLIGIIPVPKESKHDIEALKVIGFLGHLAALGCSMCLKWFPGRVGCIDYSGFDRTQWQPRNVQEHRIPLRKYSFPPV